MTGAGLDAVFLSFDEPLASVLHARTERVLGRPVKRLHGVHGMRRAYGLCARLVDTEAFFLGDGDFEIDEHFDPAAVAPLAEGVAMRVWQAVNPVNGLTYGYGGMKLIRTAALLEMGEAFDVLAALPGKVEFAKAVAGITRFDQSPFHAWKAGFRECAMLTRGCEYGTAPADAHFRIASWTDRGQGPYGEWAVLGAREGVSFADAGHRAEPAGFDLINDPAWLHRRFHQAHGTALPAGTR
ncbi:hypothetical protein OU787_17725 [Kitasatospora sp. YST-16]|uniref:hypothetical protein n=1 Tax=Kitasatospora sp. YST-16 TaxID=2998080 RepID=UPI0022838862|nr:hypothetical protein [Kitasatospora sp. YST-16]WAL73186.1 hypothetical protein OU787_17725 [Kitasatospora sp. YST-16]WNW39239.1 hypothetical protein RKE32_17685 [Streptomyces sp. Li-HN-5-13]